MKTNQTHGNSKLVIAGNLFAIQQLASKASSCETREDVLNLLETITAKAGEARRLALRVN